MSLWSADLLDLGRAIDLVAPVADGFHLDVFDGHNVDDFLFGPDLVSAVIPGHETVGVIDALGEAAGGADVGEQVTINPNAGCRRCECCREGRPLLCANLIAIGSSRPGAFAEYVVAPANQVFSVGGMDVDMIRTPLRQMRLGRAVAAVLRSPRAVNGDASAIAFGASSRCAT